MKSSALYYPLLLVCRHAYTIIILFVSGMSFLYFSISYTLHPLHDLPSLFFRVFFFLLFVCLVNGPSEAINLIRKREKPLALYVFTNDSNVKAMFETQTSSGT